MKTTSLASLMSIALTFAACGGDNNNNGGAPDLGGGATGMTIADLAVATPQLSTLVSALQKAGLVDIFKGAGPFTVFAPTNDAFAALKSAGVDATALDTATLTAVLEYHVVASKDLAADVVTKKTLPTLNGTVNVSVRGSSVYLNGLTLITKTDIIASNGVIHLIDSVLLPDTSFRPTRGTSYGGINVGLIVEGRCTGARCARNLMVEVIPWRRLVTRTH